MVYIAEWGVGREPQVRNSISTWRISEDNIGLSSVSNFPGTTLTLNLNPQERIFSLQVRIFPTSSGLSIDSARFRVRTSSTVLADYKLPTTDGWASLIDEIVPVDVPTYPGDQLIVEFGPETADATGYNIGFAVTAFSITI